MNRKRPAKRRAVGHKEVVANVDLEDFSADSSVEIWLSLIVDVGAASLEIPGLERGFDRCVVITVVQQGCWIQERQVLHPYPRPESSAAGVELLL